ncbi:MAG: hypothetical protein CM15mP84_05130 [Cellvibrionales bacterium]|nr:MAG: hypothetical protein CM15mP84_05130 [Cellvibrionales bacterium]
MKELGRRTAEMALLNPLIVTDRGSAQLPYISELQQILAEAGVNSGVFSRFHPTRLVRTLNGRANAIARAGMTA